MNLKARYCDLFVLISLYSFDVQAASFEGTLESLVNGFIGKILPILTVGYVGKNIFSHIQSDPNASKESVRVAVATVCLLGINSVWLWLKSQVR